MAERAPPAVVAAHELWADAHDPVSGRQTCTWPAPDCPANSTGIYCLATNTVLIDRRITYTRKRCALVHELVHWRHGDDTSNGCNGGKLEQRCRRETAILLIDPAEYALAERMYDSNPYQIAAELNVTVQVIEDYKNWLHDSVAA